MIDDQLRPARVRRRRLEAPIYSFAHPATGRMVRLVCMVHIGRLCYYRDLRALVEEWRADGAEVHSEGSGLGDLAANPPPDLTAEEKELIDLQIKAELQMAMSTPEAGWVHQSVGVSHFGKQWPEGWQRRDMPYLDYMRALGVDAIRAQVDQTTNPSEATRRVMGSRHMMALGMRQLAAVKRKPQPTDAVKIYRRNQIALEGVDGTDADVVLLWGGAHLPGLAEGLEARGYQLAGEQWLEVGRLPRLWLSLLALAPLVPTLYRAARDEARMTKMLQLAESAPSPDRVNDR